MIDVLPIALIRRSITHENIYHHQPCCRSTGSIGSVEHAATAGPQAAAVADRRPYAGGSGLVALLVLGVIAIAGPSERDVAIKRSGAAGEAVLPQLLRALPDTYTLLNGVPVPGSRADIDHVLVGPTGIWAIEAKHHVGMVQCVGDAWGYTRLGRGGVPHEGHIGSPSQQARRAADALEGYLRQRGGSRASNDVQVAPLVVFTHPHVELNLEAPTLTVLQATDVQPFITQQPRRLQPATCAQIVEKLRQLRPTQR
jgi:hypothetical protein